VKKKLWQLLEHCTHPNGYGLVWSWTSNPNLLTVFATMIFSCVPKSDKASIFLFLTGIFMWNSLVIFPSLLVVEGYLGSPPSALMYRWYSHPRPSYFQPGYLNQWPWDSSSLYLSFFIFKLSFRCNLQHFASVQPSILQLL